MELALLFYLKNRLRGSLNFSGLDDVIAEMLYLLRDLRQEQLLIYGTMYVSFLFLCYVFPALFFLLFAAQAISLCMSLFMISVIKNIR